jgi:hypothetical protein
MTSSSWKLACGFLVAVLIIWIIHKLGAFHSAHQRSKTAQDKVWLLEKAFFGLAVSILILGHSRELLAIFFGENPSDTVERDICLALLCFIGSAIVLLIARLADAMLGDE